MTVIFVHGAQGTGKTTNKEMLAKHFKTETVFDGFEPVGSHGSLAFMTDDGKRHEKVKYTCLILTCISIYRIQNYIRRAKIERVRIMSIQEAIEEMNGVNLGVR